MVEENPSSSRKVAESPNKVTPDDLKSIINEQQKFRDTHISRTANSREGRRAAFVHIEQQKEQTQPSVKE